MNLPRRSHTPQPPAAFRLSHRHFAVLAMLYGLAIIYSSLMLGPDGLHYVPIGAAEAWQKFRAIHFIDNASDQRSDWIANMMMAIPLAYFVNGAFAQRVRWVRNAALTLAICLVFVLAVKYAQLFFPPRTVTLNYIAAQSIGVLLGIGAFRFVHRHLYRRLLAMYRKGDGLVIVLGTYSVLLTAYFLMPFDLTLSPDDLVTRLATLPISVFPAAGRDPAYRALLVLADLAATVPAGMFLAVTGRYMSFQGLMARGIAIIIPVAILSLFVLSTTPFAFSLVSRTVGVALGIWLMWSLKGKDLWKRHYRYAQYVPVAFPVYVTLLALANGLLTEHWQSPDRAFAALESRELLPLWSLYIATKAEATRHAVETFAMFVPIGTMIWLRRGFWSKGVGLSAFVAFFLSAAIQFGRLIKPGLIPDVTDPFIAAFAAAAMFRAMPELWKLFEQEAKSSIQRDSNAVDVVRAGSLFMGIEVQPQIRRRIDPT
jgi:glycopeptide antibiotics resistance protein